MCGGEKKNEIIDISKVSSYNNGSKNGPMINTHRQVVFDIRVDNILWLVCACFYHLTTTYCADLTRVVSGVVCDVAASAKVRLSTWEYNTCIRAGARPFYLF